MVITDRKMPRMGGDEFAAKIKALDPGMPVMMLTGSAGPEGHEEDVPSVDFLLRKPFRFDALSEALSAVRGRASSAK